MKSTTATLTDAALAYAARGWHVFPLEPRGKRPAASLAQHGLTDATDDLDRVRAWWGKAPESNVAVTTGTRSGLLVIDLDGERAEDSYASLLVAHGAPGREHHPDGAVVRTGSGWHLYLGLPAGLSIRNSASRLGPGIDVRGDGGYVVAPPSVHPSGRVYIWRDHVPEGGLPTLSPRWGELLAPPAPRSPIPAAPPPADLARAERYGLAALRAELDALAAVEPGGRNDALNSASFSVGQLIASGCLGYDHAVGELARVGTEIGLGPSEVEATIRSGIEAGGRHPRGVVA